MKSVTNTYVTSLFPKERIELPAWCDLILRDFGYNVLYF